MKANVVQQRMIVVCIQSEKNWFFPVDFDFAARKVLAKLGNRKGGESVAWIDKLSNMMMLNPACPHYTGLEYHSKDDNDTTAPERRQ